MTLKPVLLTLAIFFQAFGQTTHTATLAWSDTDNPAGSTYNVWRAPVACPTSPPPTGTVFSPLVFGLTTKNYTDTVGAGSWCWQVTVSFPGSTDAAGAYAGGQAGPIILVPVKNFTVTIK